jgi:hypothetical protein
MTLGWMHSQNYFNPPPLTIGDAQIRHILQLATQEVTMSLQLNHTDKTYHLFNLIHSEKTMEYTALATIKFGYDLQDIRYNYDQDKKTFRIQKMPPVKVLDVFIEIKEFNVFKSGWLNEWSPNELTRILGSKGLVPIK